MSRPLKLSIMLALALGSTGVLAQSLGQIQVKSNLDQPLLAEVPLLSQTAGDTRNMQVTLASPEAYGRAGVDRGSVPAGLQFTVVNNAQGEPVIRITSSGPVSEPYIDLLLDVKGGKGSVVREVTLLLDPVGAPAPAVATARTPAPSAPVVAPRSAAAAVPSAPAPAPRAERTERAEPARHAASAGHTAPEGSFAPVQKGQSLSTFAKQLAGNGGDMNQALVALQKANPDAFYRDNINALKAGAVLRVPPPADISAQGAAEASSQVRKQNEDWRGGAARAPSAVADVAAGNAPSGTSSGKTAEDRLALVPAKGGDGTATRAGVADGKSQAALASLKQELARSQESLTALQQQGDELKSRVNDLEGINDKNQRLLSLKDNEIAELQHKLADARKAANLPPVAPIAAAAPMAAATVAKATPAPVASVATPPVAVGATAPAPAGSAVVTTTPLAEAKPAAPAAAAPKPTPHVVPAAPAAQDDAWYMQPIIWGAGAVVVIALAVLAVSRRRRKPVVAAVPAPSLADRFGDEPMFADEHAAVAPLHDDEDDIDQRELLDELSEHPDDVGLHLELVSLYYERRDVDHFEAAAEAMYAHVTDADQAEWQEVVHMGEDLTPQHPLFAHGHVLPPQTDDEHAALEAFDISRYAETPVDDLPPVPVTPQKHSEYHFNFDLSPRQSATNDLAADAARQAAEPFHEEPTFDTHDAYAAPVEHAVMPPELPPYEAPEEESTWKFDEPTHVAPSQSYDSGVDEFSDDPVDTKLDLARAYLDMGDHDGARAMLEEVAVEGTQMQQDVARKMLADLA